MLYLRWLEVLKRYAPRPAIYEGGRCLTFEDLAAALATRPTARGPVLARSGQVDFFVEILRAWRDGQAVIPIEREAAAPNLGEAPAGTALVKYTPGASGIPRGIFLNEPQVAADVDRLVAAMDLKPSVPNLAVISLSHSYGFSNVVLPLLMHGVPIHLAAVPYPRVIEGILKTHAAMDVAAVPSMWRAWHRTGILTGAPIRMALSAGAPLSLDLEAQVMAASGLKIRNFYGASECGGISYDASEKVRESADDVGDLLPGVDVSISADGRIVVRSGSVAGGYQFSREDDLLGDGVYQTRDFGFVDAKGRLHLTGTSGAAINVAGRKVSPSKLESAILSTGLVRRVKIHGVPSSDVERFEEISAKVEMLPGITLEVLKRASLEVLQSWEMPRRWEVMETGF